MNQIRLECECGFQGSIRTWRDTHLPGWYVTCIGCDTTYEIKENGIEKMNMPEFESYEDLQKFLDKSGPKQPIKKPKSKKPKPAVESHSETALDNDSIFFTVNFYLRPGQSWQSLITLAKEERNSRPSGVLVSVHNHTYGKECDHLCHSL